MIGIKSEWFLNFQRGATPESHVQKMNVEAELMLLWICGNRCLSACDAAATYSCLYLTVINQKLLDC